jgi:hypothetical protein
MTLGAPLSAFAQAPQPADQPTTPEPGTEPPPEPVPEPPPPPEPEDSTRAQARALFGDAGVAFEAGDFARAADLYSQSHQLYPSPTALFWEGRSLAALGRLVDAYARLDEAARWTLTPQSPEGFRNAVDEALREREALSRRVPVIVLRVGPDVCATFSVDGHAVASGPLVEHRIDPGDHVVRATAPGQRPIEVRVSAREGDRLEVPIDLAPPSAESAQPAAPGAAVDPQRIAGWALGGLGVGALIGWGVVGGLYLDSKSTADDLCDHDAKLCDSQEGVDAVENAQTLGVASVALLVGGAVTLATGVTLLLTAGGEDGDAVAVEARVGIGSVGIGGRF